MGNNGVLKARVVPVINRTQAISNQHGGNPALGKQKARRAECQAGRINVS